MGNRQERTICSFNLYPADEKCLKPRGDLRNAWSREVTSETRALLIPKAKGEPGRGCDLSCMEGSTGERSPELGYRVWIRSTIHEFQTPARCRNHTTSSPQYFLALSSASNPPLSTLKVGVLAALSCLTLCNPMDLYPTKLFCPWNSPSKNTGVGCQSLLQGVSATQGSNPGLLHCRQILYYLNH